MRDVSRIPLAIVGMACRLPGADSLEDYWRLLSGGHVGYGELPPERFDFRKHFDPEKGNRTKSYTALGGVVPPRPFDLSRYPLPKWLLEQTAESHFNMCEVAARAFENAGWDPLNPPHKRAGVYIGHAPPMSQLSRMIYARMVAHTAQYLRDVPGFDELVGGHTDEVIQEVIDAVRSGIAPDDPIVRLRAHAYYLPTLVSRQFSLDGPSMAFDAACASSLRALGHGARALQLGEIDLALVGSASYCHADTLVLFSQAQSVSATGSRPFDDDADGLVASEGYVLLAIKTLERALADGDRVQAIIRGIGISSDGKGKSLWAPRKEGQMEAVRRAYSDDVKAEDLQYVEMHATSTQVGDSTEMTALVEGLAPMLAPGQRMPVGSAKANVGHTLETAGLASLVKTVLAIQHRAIPPQINVRTPSTKIEWDQIPFYPAVNGLPWPEPASGKPRRAAVNAFGIGGLNVHVVLEEYEALRARELAKQWKGAVSPLDGDDAAIAVVGIGAVLPGVRTADKLWDVLASGERQVRPVPENRWDGTIGLAPGEDRLWTIPSNVGGFVTDFAFDWKKHKIPPKQVQTGATGQYMILDAADQALRDAGYDKRPFDREKTGVVVGTIFGSDFGDDLQMGLRLADFNETLQAVLAARGVSTEEAAQAALGYEEALLKHKPALLDETGSFTASTTASRITKTFDLRGGATAIDAGDASSFAVLNSAAQLLHTGECDVMLAAALDCPLSYAHFESLARRGVMTKGAGHAPFDAAADGLIPAEGACVLVLKRLADARRDGDRIHAIIRGIGSAWDASIAAGVTRAAQRALEQADVRGADVAAVEASGVGVPHTDREEWGALARVYGASARHEPLHVSTASAQFGHLGGGSGIVSLVKAIVELDRQEIPAMPGLNEPAADFRGRREIDLAVGATPLRAAQDEGRLLVGVNGVSQTGLSYHVVLERPTPVAPPKKATKALRDGTDAHAASPRKPQERVEPAAPPVAALTAPLLPAASALAAATAGGAKRADTMPADAKSADAKSADATPADTKPAPAVSNWQVFRLGAASFDELVGQIANSSVGADCLPRFAPDHRVRLAGVARSQSEFLGRCRAVQDRLRDASQRSALFLNDLFCGEPLLESPGESAATLAIPPVSSEDAARLAATGELGGEAVRRVLGARACLEVLGTLDVAMLARWQAGQSANGSAGAISAASGASRRIGLLTEIPWLNVVQTAGAPFLSGRQHGEALSTAIRLAVRRYADLVGTRWDVGTLLDDAVTQADRWFAAEELEELRGIAKGAGVSYESVLCHNVRLFLDGGAGGGHFAVGAAQNGEDGLIHGYNEDNRQAIAVRDCLDRCVQVRFPERGHPHLTIGVAGQLGGLSGLNVHGLSVTAACLLDGDAVPSPGRLPPSLVHEILRDADDIDQAAAVVRRLAPTVPLALLLSHGPTGRVALLEWDGREWIARLDQSALVATNHRSGQEASAPAHSRHRRERLKRLLGGEVLGPVHLTQAQFALRDQFDLTRNRDSVWPTLNTVLRVDNQASVVFQPATGKIWLTPGQRANGHQKRFLELDAAKLLDMTLPSLNTHAAAIPPALKCEPAQGGAAAKPEIAAAASIPADPTPAPRPFKTASAADVVASYDRAAQSAGGERVCERYVLRMIEAPRVAAQHASSETVAAPGRAFILGDNAVARSLRSELERQGTTTTLVPSDVAPEAALAALDAAWEAGPIAHLFLVTPHDSDALTSLDAPAWTLRRVRGVLLPYRVCQRWFQKLVEANLLGQASVTAVAALGGDFGTGLESGKGGGPVAVESGALTGLLKGVAMEVALGKQVTCGFRTKLIDAPHVGTHDADATELARFVVNELAADSEGKELEVGFAAGKRWLVRPVVEVLDVAKLPDLPRGANFVFTGGARGVTAVVARELGLRYGLKLHLIGSSPRPEIAESYHKMSADELKDVKACVMKEALANGQKPADAWSRFEKGLEIDKSLRELRAAGVQATYHGCDVSDRAALARVLDDVRRVDGPIVGVIHGAGFERASRFEKKQVELVDRTYAAKVDGAAALMELTKDDPLRCFAAFGSVSGRFGGVGQTDYSSANDMLAKLVDWFRTQRPECGAAVFHWHAWDDVGMAVRPESQHIRKLHNIRFMPSLEGANHLIDELRAGLPEGEIAITELQYCREKYGTLNAAPLAAKPSEPAPEPSLAAKPAVQPSAPVRHPLLDRVVEHVPNQRLVAEIDLDPKNDLFLVQHLYKGRPMMPVVVTVEAVAEAAARFAGPSKQVVSVRDIEIVNGLRFLGDATQTARVFVTRDGDRLKCEFTSDVVNRRGVVLKQNQPYLRCVVETADRPPQFPQHRPEPPQAWNDIWYRDEEIVIYHGPEFRCLKRGTEENGLVWGEFVAPGHGNLAGRRGADGWIMPSALIDAGFYGSGVMLWVKYQGLVAIPAGIGGITLGRPARAGEVCTALFTDRGRQNNTSLYDFTLFGDDGTVICHVDGYKNVIVAEQPAEPAKT